MCLENWNFHDKKEIEAVQSFWEILMEFDDKEREKMIDELSKNTDGYTGADIEAFVREAAILSLRENMDADKVHKKHFEEALNKIKPSVTTNTIKVYKKVEEQFLKSAKSATPMQEGSYLG